MSSAAAAAAANSSAAAAAAAASSEVGTLSISFFTKMANYPIRVPDTVFAIPANTTPQGLGALLNEVLDLSSSASGPQPFDFLVDNEFICVPVDRFLRRRGISAEGTLKIEFMPAMRAQEGSKLPHDDWVSSVCVPVAGQAQQCFVTASYDRGVRVWADEACVATGVSHLDAVKCIVHRPGSISGNFAEQIGNGNKQQPAARRGRDSTAAIPPGASVELLSGGKDGSIKIWNFTGPTSLTVRGTAKAHANGIDSIAASPNGQLVASASWDTTVKLWNVDSITGALTAQQAAAVAPLYTFTDHARPVLATSFAHGGTKLCSTGLDGAVKTYDVEKGQVESNGPATHAAHCISTRDSGATSTGGSSSPLILTGHADSKVRMLDTRANRVVTAWSGHRQWVYSVCWLVRDDDPMPMPSAQPMLASASEDSTVRVWDLRSTFGALMTFDKIHNDGVLGVTYGGNSTIVSCGKDNRTKTITVTKGTSGGAEGGPTQSSS